MKIEKYEGIITALSPIHQSGDAKTGASIILPRQKQYVVEEDDFVELPFIAGNSIRGYLRRLIMNDMCEQLNFRFKQLDTFHSFFDGGALQSIGSTGILNLELRQKVIEFLPQVHLLGLSIGNQQIPSIMQVDQALLCCNENKFRIPEKYSSKCNHDHYNFLDDAFFTRKDEGINSGIEKEIGDPTIQMKVNYEYYIPGSMFYHKFTLVDPTIIEISCFGRMIELWCQKPNIGGRSATGLGKLKFDYSNIPNSKEYLTYLSDKRDKILETLNLMQNMFLKNKKSKKDDDA